MVHEGYGHGRVMRDTMIMSASERIFSLILDGFYERRGRKRKGRVLFFSMIPFPFLFLLFSLRHERDIQVRQTT